MKLTILHIYMIGMLGSYLNIGYVCCVCAQPHTHVFHVLSVTEMAIKQRHMLSRGRYFVDKTFKTTE